MAKLKLDNQLRSTLGMRGPGFDSLRMFGLSGNQILQSSGQFNPDADLSEHKKGKVYRNQIHKYAKPHKVDGVVHSSKRLVEKPYASGVLFPVDEPKEVEAGVTGQPGEEYVTLSPERWDGNRVNMHGTQRQRSNSGFRGKKPKKAWKTNEKR